jgi:four helix bundle protein
MQDFRKLRVWQAARELTKAVYAATAGFPSSERFGLTTQMRSAALSITANIAEGTGRGTLKDAKRFFQMAFGSAIELQQHAIIASDLGFLAESHHQPLDVKTETVRRMLAGMMSRMR